MGKKSVLPTLFFPIIEGEKVQRVKVYSYSSFTSLPSSLSSPPSLPHLQDCVIYLCGTKYDLVKDNKKARKVDLGVVRDYADSKCWVLQVDAHTVLEGMI